MMYSEFVAGTACKDSPKNYEIFTHLEILYMNSDLTKEQIYEYGKKLVDNSKSQEELEAEARLKARIAEIKEDNANLKAEIEKYKGFIEIEEDAEWLKIWKRSIKTNREVIKSNNAKIRMLRA